MPKEIIEELKREYEHRVLNVGNEVEVFQKNGKWCFKVGDRVYCEGDKIGKYELRFGAAIMPNSEHEDLHLIIGFYLVAEDNGAELLEKVARELTERRAIMVYHGWPSKDCGKKVAFRWW